MHANVHGAKTTPEDFTGQRTEGVGLDVYEKFLRAATNGKA